MNDLEQLVRDAQADFAHAGTPADLENAKARYLGKSGRLTEQLKALGALAPDDKKARGALINAAKQQVEAALQARRQALADAELDAQLKAEALDVTLPGRARGAGARAPDLAHDGAHRGDLRLDGFRRGRRPGDRDRLVQLHRTEQPREPSCALDAGHLLRRREGCRGPLAQPAPAHLADADPLRPGACPQVRRRRAHARHPRDRAGPHLPRRQRRDPFADVPPGRRPVGRREHQLQGPEGHVPGLHPGLLRDHRAEAALPPELFPVHRTQRRDRHHVRDAAR